MNIPMIELKAEYELLQDEIDSGLKAALESSQFIQGPNVQALEQEIEEYCAIEHAIALASGTDALHLTLRAAGIGPGDEVITTPFTFVASASTISMVGATPVFVDIDPKTYNIDPEKIEAAITDRTRAIVPVHLYGQPADMAPIGEVADKYGLKLIEDCAQAFGADYGGKKCGALSDAGCFSFYPSKNLGGYGDGGMVVTNDGSLAERLRVLQNHGSRERYSHDVIGYNSRLDELQAVVLRVKLKRIDTFNGMRRTHARTYNSALEGAPVERPYEDGKGLHVYHQYTIASPRRDAIQQALQAAGIASAIYYPAPLHRQQIYRERCSSVSLPAAEAAAQKVISLPMSPLLTEQQIQIVAQTVRRALEA
jgi:dTDP-4-amino-4,6-dideoxygalactose transaminase